MSTVLQQMADTTFLALVAWREARGESAAARLGVMFTVLNRVAKPGWWGRDVMGVIFQRFQYSSMTDGGDPNLVQWPASGDAIWQECLEHATMALAGTAPNPVQQADSYFDDSIVKPGWAANATFVVTLGRLNFYQVAT